MRRAISSSRPFAALSPLLVAFSPLLLPCCAKVTSQGAYFSGAMYPSLVSPPNVQDNQSVPQDHEIIGSVDASCEQRTDEHERAIVNSLLSDVDCSEARLIRALRERVSEVGGTTLVARECKSSTKIEEKSEVKDGKQLPYQVAVNHLSCRADVARPVNATPKNPITTVGDGRRPQASPPSAISAASAQTTVSDAPANASWGIKIRFTPAPGAPNFPPRSSDQVEELPAAPANSIHLGDLIARCEQNCTRPAVQNGVREAAARIGANAITDLKCVADGTGWLCTGVAISTRTETPKH